MRNRKGRGGSPRMAFGCLAVVVILVVAVGSWLVVFLWDVNLPT